MKFRKLGTSDLSVSEIGFGCMSLGDDHLANAGLLHQALDLGINFFDTADLYQKGFNEETVGRAFKGMRDQVLIASKVGNQWRTDGSGWDWNPRKEYITKAVKKSLQRLGTDYLDVYQLHGGTIEDPIDETIEAFEQLKTEGLIRHYGISSIRPNVIREYVERSGIVSNMMQYSLLDRRPEKTAFDLLYQNHISIIVRGAVAKGLLAGKPPKEFLSLSEDEVAEVQKGLSTLSQNKRTPGQTAILFALRNL